MENCFKKGVYVQRGLIILSKPFGTEDGRSITYFLYLLCKSSIWFAVVIRECVRNLNLRVQVHPGELWVSKQRVHTVLEASKSAGAKTDVPKICGFVHPLHPC